MKKQPHKVIEEGDFNIYSRQVDQLTLDEDITIVKGDRIVGKIVKKDGKVKEYAMD